MFMYRSYRSDTRMKTQSSKCPWTKLLKKGDIHDIHELQHENITSTRGTDILTTR
jgi:hypothetical protein